MVKGGEANSGFNRRNRLRGCGELECMRYEACGGWDCGVVGRCGKPWEALAAVGCRGESVEDAHDLRASPLPATCRRSGRGGAIYGTSVIPAASGVERRVCEAVYEYGDGWSCVPMCKWINKRP